MPLFRYDSSRKRVAMVSYLYTDSVKMVSSGRNSTCGAVLLGFANFLYWVLRNANFVLLLVEVAVAAHGYFQVVC